MLFRNKLIYSTFISAAVLIGSIVMPIIPCRVAPLVPNPNFAWAFCSLNPENAAIFGSIRQYFGYTTNLTNAYFLTLVIVFILAMIFFHFVSGRKNKRR